MKKRVLSVLLALCMALTLLPTAAWAAEDPVAILAWIEEGQAKTVDLDASDLPGCCLQLWNWDSSPEAARTDAATLTLLKDVRLEEPLRLGYADIALDGQGATLSRGFGGSFDGAPPVMCDDGNHRLVNVTLDGTYCGEEEPTSPPTVVDVWDGASITLGSGTSIVNGGQPPAAEPDCYIPAKGGAIDLAPGGALRLEDGASITGNRGQEAGGVYAEVGSRVEFPAQTARGGGESVTIQNNTVGRRPSNLVLLTTEKRGADDSNFVPIQVSRSLAGSSIGVSRLAWSSTDYKFVTAPGVVAQGAGGYTLTQDDVAAFFSDDPLHGLSLDVEHNAIVLGDLPPHTHAMSVGCETTGGDQLTYQPLTVNGDGKLCVDGVALAKNTLSGGNYYLPGDITLDGDLVVSDPAGAAVNLCLNGHTLDLGEGHIEVEFTNVREGVLNVCDCSPAESGLITSANDGSYGTLLVNHQLSLYGGVIRNTSGEKENYAIGLNAGTADLSGGKVVSDHGIGLSIEGWQADGLALSGNVTIRGEAADILLYSPQSDWAKGHITLTGPLTKPAAPWRVAVDEPGTEAMPLLEGWATHMAGVDFSDYFQIATKGLFIGQLDNEDLVLDVCDITQQPSAENNYTVAAKGAPTYQWYPAQMVTEDVTDQNATAYSSDYGAATYDPATKLWTGVGSSFTRHFTIHLLKGETVTVKPSAPLTSRASVRLEPEPYEYSYLVYLDGNEANEAGEYVLTAPAERDYIFEYRSNERAGGADITFSATVTRPKLGAALAGQTTPTLTATQAGTYLCQVTWPNGTKQNSDIVTYTPPHVHAMSVDCETTGEDLVTFDKALTSVDGKLYVDGAEVPSEVISMSGVDMTQYRLSTGHYYLAEDVTLADKSYLFFGTDGGGDADVVVDLCLNGHVLDLGGSHSRMSVAGSAQLRVCDCGDGGAVRGAHTSTERLGAMVNVTGVLELYGGKVENTATPGQDEQARAVALFMGVATLHGGQVIAGHDVALQYDASAAGLTLYDGVTLRGGADSAEVWLSDIFGYEDDPVFTIAQPLTAPENPWRVASSKAQALTDGWATHMAGADANDYFQHLTPGRCLEKTAQGELALADYAITAQPSAANGYTVTANGAPSGYQWYKATVATAEITDQNATPYEYITGSIAPASYENGKWTAAQSSEAPEAAYFTMELQKGDKVTLTLDQLPTQGQLGLYAYGKGQLWCYFGGSREPDEGVSIDGSAITYVIPADGSYKLMLDGLDPGQTAPVLSAQLTRVILGQAVSGQTAKTLTADEEGTYLCRVTWPDGTTLNSDVVAYTPPAHVHTWGKWTLGADKETLTRVCAGDASHTESEKLACGLPNAAIVYDGAEKKPAPSLKTDGDIGALTEGTDYTVAYTNNVNAGTGSVTITGAGDFDFTLVKTFAIQKADQAAPVGVFTITDVAYGQETGAIAISGDASKLEYRLKPSDGSDPAWTAAASANQLPAGTYEFRCKATANYNASPATQVQVRVLSPDAKRLSIDPGIEHGTVTKRRDRVNPGDTVTLAVQPDEGYQLETITVRYTESGVDKTITPTVKADNAQQYTFTMPNADVTVTATFAPIPDQGDVKGEVEVKGDTPAVTVDKEVLKDLAGEVPEGQSVTVKLTVEKQEAPADQDDIQEVVTGNKSDVLYLDLSLMKRVNDEEPTPITDTGAKVLEIAVDYDFTGKKDVTVYRKHGEQDAETLTALSARPAKDFADGTFYADSEGGVVYIYASKFSTYAIGYTLEKSDPTPTRRPSRRPSRGEEETPAVVLPFTDVASTDAFYEGVKYVYEKGWMLGTSETTFEPNGTLTRGMLAVILYRTAGSPAVEGAPEFEDTLADTWYSNAIVWAAQTQVLRGYGNGKFGPNDPVSREMMNMVTARQAGQDPAWVGDPALAVPATRAEIAQLLTEQGKAAK